ncbi:hypothetical protein BYT27DRAFT_7194687 [Phlegmacium glaucopus]|nr:hypothetical protein BYT27DRAFT_7194687 [Phlegmacium glaucopus]
MNNIAVSSALGIWALSCIPTATASFWYVCTTNAVGMMTCQNELSHSARISLAITSVFVLLLLFSLVFCVFQNRRAAAASEQEYNVEASQVHGPPTIIATEYNPTSGPSGVYGGPRSGFRSGQTSAQMTGPTYPVAAQVYNNRTAPASQPTFPNQPYPFTESSSHMGPAPQTAFVSGGFPRPILAGNRLKDMLKERPASVSHTHG